jgi:hypothetical protein
MEMRNSPRSSFRGFGPPPDKEGFGVALVQSLGFNLLSMSQLLDEGFEVLFRPGGSGILDSRGDLVCMVVPKDQLF